MQRVSGSSHVVKNSSINQRKDKNQEWSPAVKIALAAIGLAAAAYIAYSCRESIFSMFQGVSQPSTATSVVEEPKTSIENVGQKQEMTDVTTDETGSLKEPLEKFDLPSESVSRSPSQQGNSDGSQASSVISPKGIKLSNGQEIKEDVVLDLGLHQTANAQRKRAIGRDSVKSHTPPRQQAAPPKHCLIGPWFCSS